ncbi:MAG: hypothetical protein KBT03_10260 [Bacteroidales bacterium]|nr:hypothetical protein [Candidatus Scybalousia scybalohippi]
MTASEADLNKWYKHCHEMLYNGSHYAPGKYQIHENIIKTWNDCNVELFVRHILYECNTALKTKKDILDFINIQKSQYENNILNESVNLIFTGLDPIFESITISQLMDACFDRLDIFNNKMVSDKFILSQGIWLTNDEKVELSENDMNGKPQNRMEVIKERLGLNPAVKLRICPTGLSFAEFRSLVQLPPLPKISSLSTMTLKTLRDKILLLLDNDLDYHIKKWTTLMNNIKKVAAARNIELPVLENVITKSR